MNYSIHTVEFRKYFEHWRDLKSFTDRMFLDAYKNYDMYRVNKIIHIEIFNGLGIRVYIREEKIKAYIGFIISLNCVKGEYKAIDLIKPNEIDEAIDLANARIRLRFGPGFSLEEMSLCRVDLCVNIDVDSRENVSEYIKLLNKTHSSKAYKLSASPYYGVENEFKATSYNGSEISIYNKEAGLSSRKNSEAPDAEGILRIEYRIKRKGEINFMTCRYTDSNIGIIKYLANNSEKIIKSIMSKLVLNADYYKPSVLQQALEANVRTNILKRRMLRLWELTSELSSLYLAKQHLKKEDNNVDARYCTLMLKEFEKLNVNVVTLDDDSHLNRLPSLFRYM